MFFVSKWRDRLQAPRRPYDTFYGRFVMRRFSIYLTLLFSKTPLSPANVTFLSLSAGLAGAWLLSKGEWMSGIFLVNLWYLLDHVDGELARLKGMTSVGGLYFDTITNALVPPAALAALGWALMSKTAEIKWFLAGIAAAYALLMLLIIPFCEAAVILQCLKGAVRIPGAGDSPNAPHRAFSPGMLFGFFHTGVTVPVLLPVLTIVVFVAAALNSAIPALCIFLSLYASLACLVWISLLTRTLTSRKVENKFAAYQ